MFSNLKTQITNNLLNLPGWRTGRRIVVIESDDWGSIRMPSKDIFNQLLKEGYQPDIDPFLRYDSLESEEDLSMLYEVISSIKDKNGNPAVITANCVLANPDFKKIKEECYHQYYFEPFTETLKRYPNHQKSIERWKEGIRRKLLYPQFHGREHLNVSCWLRALQNGDKLLRKSFDYEMISISSIQSEMRFDYMESLDYFSEEEKKEKEFILKDGLNLFENAFGFRSKSFIANCYIWDRCFERVLKSNGVDYIQGIANQIEPYLRDGNHYHRYIKHFTGQKNSSGQLYMIRNAFFEPSLNDRMDHLDNCLHRIQIAFKWNKPAIIGSHRVNYIGSIDISNRDRTLKNLQILLQKIIKKWPDVEFMSSEQLGDLITMSNSSILKYRNA